jgi:hypothetical protein
VLATALNEEMTEHLGYEKHDPPGAGTGNIRNGTRAKTVLIDTTGQVEIDVPRDPAATFEPQNVKKRERRLSGVDEVVLSLYAKGLTTGEISAHSAEIYGASVHPSTYGRWPKSIANQVNNACLHDRLRSDVADHLGQAFEAVADLHHDRVDEDRSACFIQRSYRPVVHLLDHLVGDPADRLLG